MTRTPAPAARPNAPSPARSAGSCQVPLAAYGIIEGEELYLRALVGNHKTGEAIRSEARGPWTEPEALAARVVEDLRRQGADAILKAVLG